MNKDIRDRIWLAADELFAQSETREFPSVEAVRQRSRASMNYVVEVLKEWRQHQRQQVQAVREPLPVTLQEIMQEMGQAVWETAQHLANEALNTARAAFEAEKSDLTRLSAEQSESFEAISADLELLREENTRLADELNITRTATAESVERLQANLAQAKARVEAAEALHSEQLQKAETAQEKAREEATRAREEAANLRGQLEAITAQNAALLATLSPTKKPVKPKA